MPKCSRCVYPANGNRRDRQAKPHSGVTFGRRTKDSGTIFDFRVVRQGCNIISSGWHLKIDRHGEISGEAVIEATASILHLTQI